MSEPGSELVIVGAGTMGAWTAIQAIRSGRRATTLLDAYGPGNPRASSGDETRIIRSAHGDDDFYPVWSRAARLEWMALEDATGRPIFVQAGTLWLARREDGFEAHSERTLRSLDIPVERLSPADVAARWPGVVVGDLAFALFEPEGGLLLARSGVLAAASWVMKEGGRIEAAAVRPGNVDGDRLLDVVAGDGRRWRGETFAFASGPWLPKLFQEGVGDLIRVTRQDVACFGPGAGDARWNAPAFPTWVDYDTTFYGIGAVEGRGVKVATDRYGGPWDPDTGERVVDPGSIEAARAYCRLRLPDLADAPVVETRVCQYESTADSHFLIDRHPSFSNVWIVGGGSGHGYKHGPSIGRYVVSLLDGHEPAGPERRFALARPRGAGSGLRTRADTAEAAPARVSP